LLLLSDESPRFADHLFAHELQQNGISRDLNLGVNAD